MWEILKNTPDDGGVVSAVMLSQSVHANSVSPQSVGAEQVPEIPAAKRAQNHRSVKRALRSLEQRGDLTLTKIRDPGYLSAVKNQDQKILVARITEQGRRRIAAKAAEKYLA